MLGEPRYVIEYATTGSYLDPTTGNPLWRREDVEAANDNEAQEKFELRELTTPIRTTTSSLK